MFAINFILLTFVFLFTVHCENSSGILSEDWKKLQIDSCEGDFSCIKSRIVNNLPEDAKALAKTFYNEKKQLYTNKIKFDLLYSNVVNNVFKALIAEKFENMNNTNIKDTICNSQLYQDEINKISTIYKNDIDNLINEGLQLAKDNIYYDDEKFYDFYSKNLSFIVKQFNETFYKEEIKKIIDQSFTAAYDDDKLEKLLTEAKEESNEKENCNKEDEMATSLKKYLFPWAPFISINFSENNTYNFLTTPENVELQLIDDPDKILCRVPMKQKMYNNQAKTLNFTFDLNCLQKITNGSTVTFAILEKNKGFTKYTCTYTFANVKFTFFTNEINKVPFPKDENDKYNIPKKINGTFIEYSFDQNDFEYISNLSTNISLREYGSSDLKLIIYDSENNLSFASDNCVYRINDQNQTLEQEWNKILSNLSNLDKTEVKDYLSTINKYLPDHLKSVAKNFYRTKKAYYERQIKKNIEVDFKNEIETKINKQIERKLKAQTSFDKCENEIKQDEILTEINKTIHALYKNEFGNLIEEGKTEVKTKVYFNEPKFDEVYNTKISLMVQTYGHKLMVYQLSLLVEKFVSESFNDGGVYKKFITDQCKNAANILKELKDQNTFNKIVNDKSCFSFIKTEIIDWALTLALKINDTAEDQKPCTLSKDTVFFLTTPANDSDSNSVQCELQFKPNMLQDNILFLNFKDGNCNYFPSLQGDVTYHLGTKIQVTNILTYQKQFVFPDELTYHKTYFPNSDASAIKNYNETTNKCYLPKQIEFTESFAQGIDLSNIYIEYSIDGKQFNLEQKDLIHKLPSQNSNTVSVIIHGNDTKVIFAAHNCEYLGELTCDDCKNHKECKIENQKIMCVCNDGFYGDTCEEQTSNETMVTEINDKLYDILKDDNFIVDIDKNVASINSNKVKAMTNLIHLMRESIKNKKHVQGVANITQINTLNSITENYLTNSKHDKNSKYLLALAISGNIMKLHHKRRQGNNARNLQEITESEEMIKHKIAHLLHLGAVHASSKDITGDTESDLDLLEENIYTHQWTSKSVNSALDKVNKYTLSSFDSMELKCGSSNDANYQYTLIEIPAELSQEIYNDAQNQTSRILSFNVKDMNNPTSALNCPNIKFKIPATAGMNLASNYTIDDKHSLNLYVANSTSFVDKCYRGDFDFDFTDRIKKDIVDNHGIKTISPLSKNCYASDYDESKEKVILQCSGEDLDLMIAFKVEDFSSQIESGSLFECSTDIEHIEKNIAFWIYLIVTLLTIIGMVFYVSVKYSEKQSSVMRINKAIENDGLTESNYDVQHQEQHGPETERVGALQSEGVEYKAGVLQPEGIKLEAQPQDSFGTIFQKNFIELHPLVNPFMPSLITPLSIRIAFFSFNFLNIFGFNAVFSTNDYLFDRYKTNDRNKFIFPIRDHFDKMISAIVCTMGVAVLMRAIILVTYGKRQALSNDIKDKSKDRNEVVSEFRKEMIVSRCVCVFIMMIITAWFFYFSIAWCNRYPKAQHSWGDACAWCLMFNYILFSTVYIIIISAVQCSPSCAKCAYYMKRTFMF